MRPTAAQLRPVANPVLTNMLVAFMNDDMDFIARRLAPVVSVDEESGTYLTIDFGSWAADKLQRRAYGDKYARGGYKYGSDTYKTLQWGLEHPIPDEHEALSQVPMRLQQVALQWLAQQSNIRKERALAADFFTTGVWATDNTGATDWDDASGVPITDCGTARRTIKQATGERANTIAMGEIVFDALKVNAQILARIQYTETMTLAAVEGLLAAVLGFDNLFVGRAVYNSANSGQTASLAAIIDDDALVTVVKPGTDMFTASGLKTFTWAAGGGEGSARTYRDDESDSDIVKHKEQWDQKLISSSLGYFFSDIV